MQAVLTRMQPRRPEYFLFTEAVSPSETELRLEIIVLALMQLGETAGASRQRLPSRCIRMGFVSIVRVQGLGLARETVVFQVWPAAPGDRCTSSLSGTYIILAGSSESSIIYTVLWSLESESP